jgi:hypothetical protein
MNADVRSYYRNLGIELPSGGGEWLPTPCLSHADGHANGDRNRSAAVNAASGVHHCQLHGSTSPYDMALELGKTPAAAMELLVRHGLREDKGGEWGRPPNSRALLHTPVGCSLEQYAKAKGLPADFLRTLGLSDYEDARWPGKRVLRIPYRDQDGSEPAVRLRVALEKGAPDNRFLWRKGSKPCLYGLWRHERGTSALASIRQ